MNAFLTKPIDLQQLSRTMAQCPRLAFRSTQSYLAKTRRAEAKKRALRDSKDLLASRGPPVADPVPLAVSSQAPHAAASTMQHLARLRAVTDAASAPAAASAAAAAAATSIVKTEDAAAGDDDDDNSDGLLFELDLNDMTSFDGGVSHSTTGAKQHDFVLLGVASDAVADAAPAKESAVVVEAEAVSEQPAKLSLVEQMMLARKRKKDKKKAKAKRKSTTTTSASEQ
jgi:hypothetical protein